MIDFSLPKSCCQIRLHLTWANGTVAYLWIFLYNSAGEGKRSYPTANIGSHYEEVSDLISYTRIYRNQCRLSRIMG